MGASKANLLRPSVESVQSVAKNSSACTKVNSSFHAVGNNSGPGTESGARGPAPTLYMNDPNKHLIAGFDEGGGKHGWRRSWEVRRYHAAH